MKATAVVVLALVVLLVATPAFAAKTCPHSSQCDDGTCCQGASQSCQATCLKRSGKSGNCVTEGPTTCVKTAGGRKLSAKTCPQNSQCDDGTCCQGASQSCQATCLKRSGKNGNCVTEGPTTCVKTAGGRKLSAKTCPQNSQCDDGTCCQGASQSCQATCLKRAGKSGNCVTEGPTTCVKTAGGR